MDVPFSCRDQGVAAWICWALRAVAQVAMGGHQGGRDEPIRQINGNKQLDLVPVAVTLVWKLVAAHQAPFRPSFTHISGTSVRLDSGLCEKLKVGSMPR